MRKSVLLFNCGWRQRDRTFVCNHTSAQWGRQILSDLNLTTKASNSAVSSVSCGSFNVPVAPMRELIPLDNGVVIEAYQQALTRRGLCARGSRVFIFDYGGTLLDKEKYDIYLKQTLSSMSGRAPNASILAAIAAISDEPNNTVLVITGLTKVSSIQIVCYLNIYR